MRTNPTHITAASICMQGACSSTSLVGLCTRSDYYNAMQDLRPHETPLCEIMRQPVITIRESDTITAALLVFLREPIKRLVVVADNDPRRPVGMLTPFDIIKVLSGQVSDLAM